MQKPSWSKRLKGLGAVAAVLAVVLLVVAGPGQRFGLLPFKFAVLGSALAALIAAFAFLVIVIGLLMKRGDDESPAVGKTLLALLVAGAITLQMAMWINKASSVPPIHDISTDTANPPEFRKLASARDGAVNPAEYAGAETAEQQRKAYPDIQTLVFADTTPTQAIEAAEAVAVEKGWNPVIVTPTTNTLEATDTTFWFGYRDDIVVRAEADGDATRVDIRSKSRVGVSDLGTNAQRVREFSAELRRRLGAGG